jgi:hypothetical protein
MRERAFGYGSTGQMLFMPISPKLMFAAFDPHCYFTESSHDNLVILKRDPEVDELNEMQFLHARSSIYFSDWSSRDDLASKFALCAPRRPTQWHYRTTMERVSVEERTGVEHYRKVDIIEPDKAKVYITGIEQMHVSPSRWPRFLHYRSKIVGEDTKSAAGVMRPGMMTLIKKLRGRRELGTIEARKQRN